MKGLKDLVPQLSLSVIDQGIYSGGTFIVQILVARWLSPDEFGAFAVMFSFLILLACFSNGLVIEPLSVLGPSKYSSCLLPYLSSVLKLHFLVSVSLSLGVFLILTCVFFLGEMQKVEAYVVVVLSSPFILFFWVARRVCYVREAPFFAIVGSTLYTVTLIVGLYILQRNSVLSPISVFLVMGGGSLFAGILTWYINIKSLPRKNHLASNALDIIDQKNVYREHMRFGKWIVLGAIPNWIAKMAYIPLVGLLLGLPQAGAFRAVQNLILPVQQILIAMGSYLLPWLAKNKGSQSATFFREKEKSLIRLNALMVIGYLTPLFMFGKEILAWVYQNDYYSSFTPLLPIFGFVAIVAGFNQAWSTLIKAMEWSYGIFQARCIGAFVSVFVGWSFISYFGVAGAVVGLLVSSTLEVFVLLFVKNKVLEICSEENVKKEVFHQG